jgi:hypothetical protein
MDAGGTPPLASAGGGEEPGAGFGLPPGSASGADESVDSIIRSPTGINHASRLAKGSADLKEQLRLMMGTPGNDRNGSVVREIVFGGEDSRCVPNERERERERRI